MLQHANHNQLTATGRGAPTVSAAGLVLRAGLDRFSGGPPDNSFSPGESAVPRYFWSGDAVMVANRSLTDQAVEEVLAWFGNRVGCMGVTRDTCELAITERGDRVWFATTRRTGYLVAGLIGRSYGVHSTHGTKVP